ncbi:unnamed protein product [Paramecium octaurelia]|uniref:Uncharacterized protein n=1 Tax=Paramecium octaurelia TaxID=43137 RepID=A0A8S1V069_PAROT|nr:unnamed protein product [Paramecium octaurelia]
MSLLCLTALSRVESVQELLQQTKDQYHLEQDIDALKSIFEAELDIKQQKDTSDQLPSFYKDSIQQSILLAKVIKSEQNLTKSTYPNTSYNYTYQSSSNQYPTFSNSSNSSNTSNTTNESYPQSNPTQNYAYPSTSNSFSSSSSQKATNQTSTINYVNGSSNYNNTINSRYIPSRLQLKVRNNSKLQQGQLKENTQNVTFYNASSGTYEYVIIYNNTDTQENNTESEYYYYQNSKVVTLEREYDDQGNVIYRNFNLNYSLIVTQKSTNSNLNEQQQTFGTLVYTNQTISAEYKTQGRYNRLVSNNDGSGSDYQSQVYDISGKAKYSNQIGNYEYLDIDFGSANQRQTNGSEYNSDEYTYDDLRKGSAWINRDQNASTRSSNEVQKQTQYQISNDYTSGNNSSISHYQKASTKNNTEQTTRNQRTNGTISNTQDNYQQLNQSQSNSTTIRYNEYQAETKDQRDTQLKTSYSDSKSNYKSNQTILEYNYTLNEIKNDSFDNSSTYYKASNKTYENIEGSQSWYAYYHDNQTHSYISGSNQGILNQTNSQFTSGPNSTVDTIDSKVTTARSYNYKRDDQPYDYGGSSQTTHTQSTVEESKQQFNQLRGLKKQASGSWRQIETAELQQSNSMIIEEAINEINNKFNPQQDGYQFESVISVQEQIVSGINYKIYLNYSKPRFESQIFEVIINSIPWKTSSNQVIQSARLDKIEN